MTSIDSLSVFLRCFSPNKIGILRTKQKNNMEAPNGLRNNTRTHTKLLQRKHLHTKIVELKREKKKLKREPSKYKQECVAIDSSAKQTIDLRESEKRRI